MKPPPSFRIPFPISTTLKGQPMLTIRLLAAATLLSLSTLTQAADSHAHAHDHEPLHGGIVTEVKDVDYELVAHHDVIQLHVRDHGKAVDLSQAAAKVTILSGTEKQEVELKPAGGYLEARGAFKTTNAKIVAAVMLPGKPTATVRFAVK